MSMPKLAARWLAILTLWITGTAHAVELIEGKLNLNLFGGGAYAQTIASSGNHYRNATPLGNFENSELALLFNATPLSMVVLSAQVYLNTQGARLDWAFAELRFSDLLKFRGGRLKHPIGIFGEVLDVGTLRPFYFLPASVYGPSGITTEELDGAMLTGTLLTGGWEFSYDLYGGFISLSATAPYDKVIDPSSLAPGAVSEIDTQRVRNVLGGRLAVSTPMEGLSFRLSGYTGVANSDAQEKPRVSVGPSVEYLTERISLRSEYFLRTNTTDEFIHSFYLEGAVFLTQSLQVAARGELSMVKLTQFPQDSGLMRHVEGALSVNYWFEKNLVVKLSYHLVVGNRFAYPALLDDAILNGTLSGRTHVLVIGPQFSY